MSVKPFYKEESATNPGKWLIKVKPEEFFINYTNGSLNYLQARLFGISYPDYMRMCRDCFGAEIIGKNSNTPVAYFKNGNGINSIIALLNARAEYVLWMREHPDNQAHCDYVKEKNPRFYAKNAPNLEKITNE